MSTGENKLLVRRQFDEIWNAGNWATADELYAQEYVNHDPYNPGQGTGPGGFKQRVSGYRSVLHDFGLRIERQVAEGDMVETHWSLRGIHGGELEGTAPTGRSVYVDGQLRGLPDRNGGLRGRAPEPARGRHRDRLQRDLRRRAAARGDDAPAGTGALG